MFQSRDIIPIRTFLFITTIRINALISNHDYEKTIIANRYYSTLLSANK